MDTNVDPTRIMKITKDCFNCMKNKSGQKGQNGQKGGGSQSGGVAASNFGALLPYLAAHNVPSVTNNTPIPAGFAGNHPKVQRVPYWTNIPAGAVLRPAGVSALNKELKKYKAAG